ncbi:LysR family transcriptional regulator [Propionivibrio sp.]|uniref:LysR family transcriptional regulator n=1 Tax=Propionivibrio sp. TaxID=2212460 RepID=UPI0025E3FD30|nr:LysR family transcriptional regulator [Propionivibrio sp.]MBK7356712.1 LysR family transcriptional regulator [Propionivibrio sp.]MBK8401120.1 LysR family transcriptional regulator [Propionivibrio sp.]MBL0208450.1 LysR family transcriptional regulator [Propionivibrio sp.]
MRFSLRQIAVFVAVARQESVSLAAKELSLSQSATSTSLGELERLYETQLFDRVGKALRLNELGQSLLPQAVEFIERATAIEAVLEGRSGYGKLRIGATLTIGNYLATLIVADYLKRHPESAAQLQVHNTATIIDQVARYELDLGLIEGNCRHPELVVVPWVEDELVVFCAPTHRLARQGKASLAELAEEHWIVREPGSGTRETLDQALRHHHSELKVRLELEHTEAIKRAVEFGLGIGCISRLALREAFRRGSLVAIETPELDLLRYFQFLWHKRKFQTAGMQEFIALCRGMTAGIRRSDEIDWPVIP